MGREAYVPMLGQEAYEVNVKSIGPELRTDEDWDTHFASYSVAPLFAIIMAGFFAAILVLMSLFSIGSSDMVNGAPSWLYIMTSIFVMSFWILGIPRVSVAAYILSVVVVLILPMATIQALKDAVGASYAILYGDYLGVFLVAVLVPAVQVMLAGYYTHTHVMKETTRTTGLLEDSKEAEPESSLMEAKPPILEEVGTEVEAEQGGRRTGRIITARLKYHFSMQYKGFLTDNHTYIRAGRAHFARTLISSFFAVAFYTVCEYLALWYVRYAPDNAILVTGILACSALCELLCDISWCVSATSVGLATAHFLLKTAALEVLMGISGHLIGFRIEIIFVTYFNFIFHLFSRLLFFNITSVGQLALLTFSKVFLDSVLQIFRFYDASWNFEYSTRQWLQQKTGKGLLGYENFTKDETKHDLQALSMVYFGVNMMTNIVASFVVLLCTVLLENQFHLTGVFHFDSVFRLPNHTTTRSFGFLCGGLFADNLGVLVVVLHYYRSLGLNSFRAWSACMSGNSIYIWAFLATTVHVSADGTIMMLQ